jgi:hypothetical protein
LRERKVAVAVLSTRRTPSLSIAWNFGVCEYRAVAAEQHLLVNIPARKTAPTALEMPNWSRRRSDRSRRKQSAALLSVPVCDFGSSAGSPLPSANYPAARRVRILTKYETDETRKTLRPIRRTGQSGDIDPPEDFIRGSSGWPRPYPITGLFI